MADNKIINAGDLLLSLRDDIEINGANLALVRRHIDAAPAVDAVEVVRCKDCKWYDADLEICVLLSDDGDTYDSGCDVEMKPDDFCSYGERREGE